VTPYIMYDILKPSMI